jgi:hypothetical protein
MTFEPFFTTEASTPRLAKADIVRTGVEQVDPKAFEIPEQRLHHRPIIAELLLLPRLPFGRQTRP